MTSMTSSMPFVRIIEQPARGGTRFRYECEGRSAGSIPGVNATSENATYPTIQVVNYRGPALVVVSCVTKDYQYRQHPHNLVGERCSNGICKTIIDNKDMIASFPGMGIQCAKRNDIRARLKKRQSLGVDPFECGFDHMHCSSFEINLSAVRLCFQVFIEDPKSGQFTIVLQPVVSEVIFDKKSCTELSVHDVSTTNVSISGCKLMLFTSFIQRDDIEVRFYQIDGNNSIVWQEFGTCLLVHRHTGLSMLTPKYHKDIKEAVQIYLQLRRPSDNETSSAIKLKLVPKNYEETEELINTIAPIKPIESHHYLQSSSTSSSSSASTSSKSHHNSSPKKRHYNYNNDNNTNSCSATASTPSSDKESSYPILNAAIRRELSAYQTNSNTKLLADLILPGSRCVEGSLLKMKKITSIECMREFSREKNEECDKQVEVDSNDAKSCDKNGQSDEPETDLPAKNVEKSQPLEVNASSCTKSTADFACQVDAQDN